MGRSKYLHIIGYGVQHIELVSSQLWVRRHTQHSSTAGGYSVPHCIIAASGNDGLSLLDHLCNQPTDRPLVT